MNIQAILDQFNLKGNVQALPGGTRTAFKVGDVVLKQVHAESLENNHSPALAAWIAEFSATLPQTGFRIPRPVPTRQGEWITKNGWTAWTYLTGRHARPVDIKACIDAIRALHEALKGIPQHPLMVINSTPWGLAHRWCWGDKPEDIQPQLQPLVYRLYRIRTPLPALEMQLIHGDLSAENILVAPDLPPAILDLSPFWGTPDFALAIFANFIGPRQGDLSVLEYFKHIPHFDQLLVRAAIRMLLVMAVIDHLQDWQTCPEKRAAEMIISYLS